MFEVLRQVSPDRGVKDWAELQRMMEPLAKAASALPPTAIRLDPGVAVTALGRYLPHLLSSGADASKLVGPFSKVSRGLPWCSQQANKQSLGTGAHAHQVKALSKGISVVQLPSPWSCTSELLPAAPAEQRGECLQAGGAFLQGTLGISMLRWGLPGSCTISVQYGQPAESNSLCPEVAQLLLSVSLHLRCLQVIDGKITDPFVRNWLDLLCFLLSGLPANGTIAAEASVCLQSMCVSTPWRMDMQCLSTLIALCWTQPCSTSDQSCRPTWPEKESAQCLAWGSCSCLVAAQLGLRKKVRSAWHGGLAVA